MFYLGLRQVVFVAWDRQEPIVPGAWNTLRWLFGATPAGGATVTLGRIVAVYEVMRERRGSEADRAASLHSWPITG